MSPEDLSLFVPSDRLLDSKHDNRVPVVVEICSVRVHLTTKVTKGRVGAVVVVTPTGTRKPEIKSSEVTG